jgi:hypothetical protein
MEMKRARLQKRKIRLRNPGRVRNRQLLLVMGLSIAISGVDFHDRAMGPRNLLQETAINPPV